uniref:response regulator transcription factor n=1 Tax=Mastigocoleus sp. MO_188.B34 TaxID=3036635 RepID=UPI0026130F03
SQGHSQLGPTIAPKVFAQLRPPVVSKQNSYENLFSERELDVLRLISQGKNNREIAKALYLTEGTVKNYVTQILGRLELRDRTQAALWAKENLNI